MAKKQADSRMNPPNDLVCVYVFLLFSQKGATKLKELDPKRSFEAVAAEIEAQYVQ